MCSRKILIAVVSMAVSVPVASWAQPPATPAPPPRTDKGARADYDSSLDFPELPKGKVSLVGGTVVKLDPVRDRLVLRAFGGRDVTVAFDVRTKVLRDDTPVSTHELRPGARVYADTSVVNGKIFAKTIRIATSAAMGEASGQVTAYDPATRTLKMRNTLAAEPLEMRIVPETAIRTGDQPADASQLAVGTLVHVTFGSRDRANTAKQIDILARPGSTFTFAGKLTFVDLRTGYVAIADPAGANTYEVAIDHLTPDAKLKLKEGNDVVVQAKFDGQKYQAQTIDATPVHSN